jgi:hypothetical protein
MATRIIDYSVVLETLTGQGMRCNYPNGGAFGFAPKTASIRGWIGPADSTILAELRPMVRTIPPPFEANLANSAVTAWQKYLSGPLWVMPATHWAFELQHGSGPWLAEALGSIGVDAAPLAKLTNAAAIEFSADQTPALRQFLQRLLEGLTASDFVMAWSGRQTLCTVHHHKQLWWSSASTTVVEGLDAILPTKSVL